MPKDWIDVIENARVKPSPFHVIEVDREFVRNWSSHQEELYVKQCPFPSRPLRELVAERQHPRFLKHRSTYHGHWEAHVINKQNSVPPDQVLAQGKFLLPEYAYQGNSFY